VDFAGNGKPYFMVDGIRIVAAVVALGSLGEASTLDFDEKIEVLKACKRGLQGRGPLVAGVAAISTAGCGKSGDSRLRSWM